MMNNDEFGRIMSHDEQYQEQHIQLLVTKSLLILRLRCSLLIITVQQVSFPFAFPFVTLQMCPLRKPSLARLGVCLSACVCARVSICACVCACVCMCVRTCVCACVYVSVLCVVHLNAYVCTHHCSLHIHSHIVTYEYVY